MHHIRNMHNLTTATHGDFPPPPQVGYEPSLGLYFVRLYCFNLVVCPHPFVFPWAVESSPLHVLALA